MTKYLCILIFFTILSCNNTNEKESNNHQSNNDDSENGQVFATEEVTITPEDFEEESNNHQSKNEDSENGQVFATEEVTITPEDFEEEIKNISSSFNSGVALKKKIMIENILGNDIPKELRQDKGLKIKKVKLNAKNALLQKLGEINYKAIIKGVTLKTPMAYDGDYTCNFADKKLFGYAFKGLFAQDEVQTIEVPVLLVIRRCIDKKRYSQLELDNTSAIAINGVTRRAQINTQSIYGALNKLKTDDIPKRISKKSTKCNILCVAAPHIQRSGQFYRQEDFEKLLFPYIAACYAALEGLPDQEVVVIETGNWGCGAFGNAIEASYLAQIMAAAYVTQHSNSTVKLHIYPIFSGIRWNNVQKLVDVINTKNPQTLGQGIQHAVEVLQENNIKIEKSNGT